MPASIVYCPHCGKPMTLPDGAIPASLECPHCRYVFSLSLPHGERGTSPSAYLGPNISPKSRLLAGVLGLILGGFGIHRFYLGYAGIGLLQIAVTVFSWVTCLRFHGYPLGVVWGFVEGIYILTGRMRDAQGRQVANL